MGAGQFFSLCIFLLLGLDSINAKQYTIIGGRKLRPFSDFSVAVTWTGDSTGNLLLEILGHRLPGGPYREAQQNSIDPGTTKIFTFKIGKLDPGNYTLNVRSNAGEVFSDSTQLEYVDKSYCAFLHTDKTVYQPGDTIYFRLLALNVYLKPVPNVKSHITLKDGGGNTIRQWLNVPLSRGVYSGELQLADFPVLGDWTFEIELNGQMYMKKVFVVDFVLPKFLVTIDAPKHVYFNDEKFSVSVRANELTGQEVNGELTVTAYPVFYSGIIQPIFQTPVRKVMYMNGKADVEINIKNELKLTEAEGSERILVVEAAVEESLTGRRHNISSVVHLHRTRHIIKYDIPRFYKPNLPFTVQVMATSRVDGNSLKFSPAKVMYNYLGEGEKVDNVMEGSCMFNENGNCQYTFIPSPVSNQSVMNVEINYLDIKREARGIYSAYSPFESYLQIKLLKQNPMVNDKVQFILNATEPLTSFSYYVMGRGDIIYATTANVVPSKKVEYFEFQATQAMSPEATIIVMYIRNNKEIISASMQFKVNGLMKNNVQLTIKPDDLEPMGNLDINVAAAPNSYVALMANAPSPDFSISTDHHYQGGEGNGLSMNDILEELRSFTGIKEFPHPTKELSASFTLETFEKAGVFLMTNNIINRRYAKASSDFDNFVEENTRPPLAGPYAFSHLPVPPAPRLHLGKMPTPTWLFTNITLGGNGFGTLGRKVSDKAGSDWSVGAWVMHPTLGLGFATPVKARMKTKMLSVAAPAMARVRETITVTATLRNPYNIDLSADITLHNTDQEFKFEQITNDPDARPKIELYQRQKLTVPKARSASVVFFITPSVKPTLTGTAINLALSATARGVSETLQQQLMLYPEGEEMVEQVTELLDLRNGPVKTNLILKESDLLNKRRVRRVEEEIRACVSGSLISNALKLLPKFLEIPPAGGYHNMLPFMGTVLLLQHLEQENQLPESVKMTGVDIMQKLYQQQMDYRQSDGSFSLSSQTSTQGSVWATGMTAQWFGRALRISEVNVDRNVFIKALQWLANQQSPDGSFRESPFESYDDSVEQQQVTLTALTLGAFIDARSVVGNEYNNLMNKAQDWLARNIATAADEQWDATILAPLAGVLHAAGHPTATQATNLLNSYANASDGHRWWKLKTEDLDPKSPWNKHGSRNIWATSWGLQALMAQGYLTEAIEAGKTLVSLLGDWTDLPQVLIAMPALIELSQRVTQQTRANIEFQCANERTPFTIAPQNLFMQQKIQIRQKDCKIDGEGYGIALVSIQTFSRTNVTGAWPRFTLDPRIDAVSTPHRLQLSICMGFVPLPEEKDSGPVLLKLRLPTGFVADLDIPALKATGMVREAREVMSSSGAPPLELVLAPLNKSETCLTIRASRLYPVANERPGVVTLIDLTDNIRRARAFFSGGSRSACELCGGQGNRRCGDSDVDIPGNCLAPARQEAERSLFDDDDQLVVQGRSSNGAPKLILTNPLILVITLILPRSFKTVMRYALGY